jgi:hypothetical protein
MYAAYHLMADEIDDEFVKTLKTTYHQREIVILPGEVYDEMEKARHNAAYTEKLRKGIRDIEEGKGTVKTMAELEVMAHG